MIHAGHAGYGRNQEYPLQMPLSKLEEGKYQVLSSVQLCHAKDP